MAGRPLVEWSLEAFRGVECVRSIVVACPPGRRGEIEDVVAVEGGATRSQSVRNALRAVETELVAIHDAARPLVTPALVEEVVGTLIADPDADGAIAAGPVTDTIKRVGGPSQGTLAPFRRISRPNGGRTIEATVDRDSLWAAQTPQVFRSAALRAALDAYPPEAPEPTDEAMLIELTGGKVLIHPSPAENPKVTTPLDLRVAELLLADRAR